MEVILVSALGMYASIRLLMEIRKNVKLENELEELENELEKLENELENIKG